jgi:GT2 family glycosyltransferase
MPGPLASVVIVSWNTQGLLHACLESLAAGWPGGLLEVVVVDNGSNDGTASMIKAEHPGTLLVETGENLGYSKAINLGLTQCTADFVCLLNSDTRMLPTALKTMVDYLGAHPDVGLVGPVLLNPDGSHQSAQRQFPFFWTSIARLVRRQFELQAPRSPERADWLVGACLMLSRHTLLGLGGMDESYPFYGEDMDLAYRVHQEGLQVVHLPSARVIHIGEGSSRDAGSPSNRVRSYYEAPLRFLRSHGTPAEVLTWRLVRGVAAAARYGVVRLALRGADADRQLALWSGVLQLCISGSPRTWSLGAPGYRSQ